MSENKPAAPSRTELTPTPEQIQQWHSAPLCKRAVAVYQMLVEKGCEKHLVDGHLRRISFYRDISFAPGFVFGLQLYCMNRQILGLSRSIRKTAEKAKQLRKLWAVWGRFADAGCADAPEQLAQIAQRIYNAYNLQPQKHNPHREAILDLLALVKSATGRYHYSEVADLINARLYRQSILYGEEESEVSYDVPALKKMIQRQERAIRPALQKPRKPLAQTRPSKKTEVPPGPNIASETPTAA